jgi:excisionase family DNA binding protein
MLKMVMQQQIPSPDFSVRDVATKCKVTERHVWRLIAENKIPSYKIGASVRIPAEAVEMLRSGQPVHDDLDAQIKRIVDRAPKLSAAQRDTLAALLADDDDA